MSPKDSHLESLETHVHVHEDRLKFLREQLKHLSAGTDPGPKGDPNPKPRLPSRIDHHRSLVEREIVFHEELLELVRDPKVAKALTDLTRDPDFRQRAEDDPDGLAQKLGLKVPAKVKLRIEGSALGNVRMQVLSYERLCPFSVTWDSEVGFSPVRESTVANKEQHHGH